METRQAVKLVPAGTHGNRLAYRTAGEGDRVVVCVHGFSQSSLFWAPTLAVLPAGFRGYAVDLPGFGDSAMVPGPYSIAGHAAAVDELMALLGVENVVLAGNSMGGVVCQYIAVHHPVRIGRLALVSTGAYARDPAGAEANARKQEIGPWDQETAAAYVQRFFMIPPDDLQPFVEAALKANRQARVETTRSSAALDLRPELPRVRVPTLVVQGERDAGRTPADGQEIARLIPNAACHVVPGAGHTPMLEDPARWRRLFHQFIQE